MFRFLIMNRKGELEEISELDIHTKCLCSKYGMPLYYDNGKFYEAKEFDIANHNMIVHLKRFFSAETEDMYEFPLKDTFKYRITNTYKFLLEE